MFVHEECGNLKVFVDGGELTRNINQKKNPDVCPLSDKFCRRKYFFSKHVEYYESVR